MNRDLAVRSSVTWYTDKLNVINIDILLFICWFKHPLNRQHKYEINGTRNIMELLRHKVLN